MKKIKKTRHKCKQVEMIRVERGSLKRYCNIAENYLAPVQYCKGYKIKEDEVIPGKDQQWLKFARLASNESPIRMESDDFFLVCDGVASNPNDANSHDEIVCGPGEGTIRIYDGDAVYSVRLLLK